VATASGACGFDLAGRQIGHVATPERRLQGQRLAAPIRIDVSPTASGRKWRATIDGTKVCVAAAPMVKAARLLIAKSYDPSCIIEMSHKHAAAWALRGQLGAVAAVVLDGERTARRRAKNGPPVHQNGRAPQ
jgi:hypothetical protein